MRAPLPWSFLWGDISGGNEASETIDREVIGLCEGLAVIPCEVMIVLVYPVQSAIVFCLAGM